MPDLPYTLEYINLHNNQLEANYPLIFTFKHNITKEIVAYVNECNAMRRIQMRLKAINKNNILLELYMKRVMHPSKIAALTKDESIDIDEFMSNYVASL